MKNYKSLSSAPGITYNVAKCKGGYGVYLCALSGQSLADLCGMFPGMRVDMDDTSPTYAQILLHDEPINAVRVNSNRIARAPSYAEGVRIIERLKAKSEQEQLTRIMKLRVWLVQKDKVLVKGKYFQIHRNILGKSTKLATSQDKGRIEKLVDSYICDGVPAKVVPTVTRTKVLHPYQTGELWDPLNKRIIEPITGNMELTPYMPVGATTKRGVNDAARIMGKRKRTTTTSFYNRWK